MALYDLPSVAVLLLAWCVAIGVAFAIETYMHRRLHPADLESHNQVGGHILAIAGTLYAVVLAFMTVVVWQQYQSNAERVSYEAAALSDAWHTAVAYPVPVRSALRHDMMNYVQDMVNDEWPLMRQGRFSAEGDRLLMQIMAAAGTYVPRNPAETNAQQLTQAALVQLHDTRVRRLSTNETGMSWLSWTILFTGALIVLAISSLFGMRSERTHVIMTSAVAIMIASMLVLIFEMQFPFRSDLGIAPTAWTGLQRHIQYMDSTMPASMGVTQTQTPQQ